MKKRICFIAPKFLNYIGGMETHGYAFAKWFDRKEGFEISSILTNKVVTDGIYLNAEKKVFNQKIKRILTNKYTKDINLILDNSPIETEIYFFNSTHLVPLLKELREKRPLAKIILRSGGTDLVAGWIGDENDPDQDMIKNRKIAAKMINKYSDFLIVNSQFSKKRFIDIGINEDKMIVLTGGVDCNSYNPSIRNITDNNINILHVSRFVRCKGIENTIKAFVQATKKTTIQSKLFMVGGGPEEKNLKRLVEDLHANNIIEFTGLKRIEEVPDYFNISDIFLHLPITLKRKERGGEFNHVESMGRVFCEAAAAGIPAIAFAVGGVPEVIDNNKTGFLLKEGDIKGASEKIINLIENNKLRKQMGKLAREKALNKFDWKIIFKKYNKLFQ
ncbi:MAG: glycosyltransferase family 4 protein [Nanoarchaeota archaeon]